jgi:hypothetical protein
MGNAPLPRQESFTSMTYTIALKPGGKGQVTAASSDGYTFTTRTPLLTGARHWLEKGTNPDTYLVTVWSSGSTHWSLRSTIGAAAKLTVDDTKTPRFKHLPRGWNPDH